jgi:hypothetical protein
MADDDTFTGGIAGHVRRIAERQEADRQRTEEQARGQSAVVMTVTGLSSIMDCQNLPCRAFGEP